MISLKEKVCATYVHGNFTAGHRSTQRIEGMNAATKGCGNLKKVMMRWNLKELLDHIRDNEDSRNQKSLVELIKLLKGNKKFSKFVEDVMDKENDEGAKFKDHHDLLPICPS